MRPASPEITIPTPPICRPSDTDLDQLVKMIDDAKTMAIFGGDGCRDARDEVIQLAEQAEGARRLFLSAASNGWNTTIPNAVGMTGLLGYGGAYSAIHEADLLLLLGTDFPFSEFLPGDSREESSDRQEPQTHRSPHRR